jgi:hypothetical protein
MTVDLVARRPDRDNGLRSAKLTQPSSSARCAASSSSAAHRLRHPERRVRMPFLRAMSMRPRHRYRRRGARAGSHLRLSHRRRAIAAIRWRGREVRHETSRSRPIRTVAPPVW